MSNKEPKQTEETESNVDATGASDNGVETTQSVNTQRRRALLAGLAAAPVILTLMNRSAWGANCSDATVVSFQQQGGLTASFTRRHPDATISGGQLQCGAPRT
jgi:hypothetical protein